MERPDPETLRSFGAQELFFLGGNFSIIKWDKALDILLSEKITGGKQYHTGWIAIYCKDGDSYLTRSPESDGLWKFLGKNSIPHGNFGTE